MPKRLLKNVRAISEEWGPLAGLISLVVVISVGVVYFRFEPKIVPRLDQLEKQALANADLLTNTLHRLNNIQRLMADFSTETFPGDGLIANFAGSPNRDVRTSQQEQLSILSDSAFNGTSTLHYERIALAPGDGDGFLRIHYDLRPNEEFVPYVGVYANFSNPVKMHDISHFTGVELSIRSTNGIPPGIKVFFQLCDANSSGNGNYFWQEIPLEPVSINQFQPVQKQFRSFKRPPWSGASLPFKDRQVFRFIFKIQGTAGESAKGFLDIDNIRFIQ